MTIEEADKRLTTRAMTDADITASAHDLIAQLTAKPWGQVGPSVYETARLVTAAPWLTGHDRRVQYLLDTQRPDGGWGPPEAYALVPTLSATEALLHTLRRRNAGAPSSGIEAELAGAADRGLQALFGWLQHGALSIPDTPAIDVIVPALVAAINEHLDEVRDAPIRGLDAWSGDRRLGLPPGMNGRRLAAVRHQLAAGAELPAKLRHFLEVLGNAVQDAPGMRPGSPGAVGASPAATVAWLGGPAAAGSAGPAREFLEDVVGWHRGPVPCPIPITVFERAWVLSSLVRAGVPLTVPPALLDELSATVAPAGIAAGAGLPADADTSSVTLYALGKLGRRVAPDSLWAFETEAGFCTWPGEDGFSVTTNAHVLDAFGQYTINGADASPRELAVVDKLSATLPGEQQTDGSWRDRWHASPYYATACCAVALDQFGCGPAAVEAVAAAVDWVLATQRTDGSWGRWSGTAEETAYAMQVLLTTGNPARRAIGEALGQGHTFLAVAFDRQSDPPLWYGKELYLPTAIVRAAVLAALYSTPGQDQTR
ncbi:prenyltransferase/squalene oxidase repeat-containing protein [Dactylosporangium sucinum]|uniref:Type B diterpene cyclase n=1 Tax=Dactylosporangium sucinum TaxID=1424081 RepID=A0A917WRP4_9ACTN|nr:prenyltransferase/squalene oxidase repeat-containing protein [Dactylosporangium sucinum]GGM23727.1 type B diterpene cyclase [Dactylosporangium sucinum]